MAGRKYSNQTGKRKPREELNIGPATPLGRGPGPIKPRAHDVARGVVGAVAGAGALGVAGRVGQAAINLVSRSVGPYKKATDAAINLASKGAHAKRYERVPHTGPRLPPRKPIKAEQVTPAKHREVIARKRKK